MTIDEAIKVNEDNRDFFKSDGFIECADAVQLGIEALKALLDCRKGECSFHDNPILGETT